MRLSGLAEQGYTMLYGKCQFTILQMLFWESPDEIVLQDKRVKDVGPHAFFVVAGA
jgi:hypothetical protein